MQVLRPDGLHDLLGKGSDPEPVRLGRAPQDPLRFCFPVLRGKYFVIMNCSFLFEKPERCGQVFLGSGKVAHDDAVCLFRNFNFARIAFDDCQVPHAILQRVLAEIERGNGIQLNRVDAACGRELRDPQTEIADAREHVHDDFALFHQRNQPLAFEHVPFGKHDFRDIEQIADTVFEMFRLRSAPGDQLHARFAQLAADWSALDADGTELRAGAKDSFTDCSFVWAQFFPERENAN